LNDLAENERILDNKIALLHEEQRRMFEEARNSKSPGEVKTFTSVLESPTKRDIAKRLMFGSSKPFTGGKSRRVFRKKTKTTRRRNKKSNRSHRRRRRTSHVAKQT